MGKCLTISKVNSSSYNLWSLMVSIIKIRHLKGNSCSPWQWLSLSYLEVLLPSTKLLRMISITNSTRLWEYKSMRRKSLQTSINFHFPILSYCWYHEVSMQSFPRGQRWLNICRIPGLGNPLPWRSLRRLISSSVKCLASLSSSSSSRLNRMLKCHR